MDQTFAELPADDPELVALVAAQVAEVARRYRAHPAADQRDQSAHQPDQPDQPDQPAHQPDERDKPDEREQPTDPALRAGARFIGLRVGGDLAGCVALQPLAPGVGEIKRMYVAPSHRGHGLGRTLLRAAEVFARRCGYATLRLETGDAQPEAVALYDSSGWSRIPGYGYWKDSPRSICFEKVLGGDPG